MMLYAFWTSPRSTISSALATSSTVALLIPVTKPPRGERPGGVINLGEILNGLQGPRLDEGWRIYLVVVLADPLGINLRNDVAHGTRPNFTQIDAALLLHVICLLAGMSIRPPESPDGG
jgi:hypothetical protein